MESQSVFRDYKPGEYQSVFRDYKPGERSERVLVPFTFDDDAITS